MTAVLLAGFLASCRTFPVRLFVEPEALETLQETEYVEELDEADVALAMAEQLDYDGGALSVGPAIYHRVDLDPPLGPYRPVELERADSIAVRGLQPGDLVLAKNRKPQSLGTTLTLVDFTIYDHAAVLAIEGGRYFVYESWPSLNLFVQVSTFAARFRGSVHRVPLGQFAARYETLEFIRLPDAERNRQLVDGARVSVREGIRYDPLHDPENPDLSCSEYIVYLLNEKAGYDVTPEFTETSGNPSLRRLMDSLGFRTEAYIVPDWFRRVPGAESVALLSRLDSRAKVVALTCAYEVLHEHFVQNSAIGSYLTVHPWRLLRLRGNVEAFLEWALGYGAQFRPDEAEQMRAGLERMLPIFFRPVPPDDPRPGP